MLKKVELFLDDNKSYFQTTAGNVNSSNEPVCASAEKLFEALEVISAEVLCRYLSLSRDLFFQRRRILSTCHFHLLHYLLCNVTKLSA